MGSWVLIWKRIDCRVNFERPFFAVEGDASKKRRLRILSISISHSISYSYSIALGRVRPNVRPNVRYCALKSWWSCIASFVAAGDASKKRRLRILSISISLSISYSTSISTSVILRDASRDGNVMSHVMRHVTTGMTEYNADLYYPYLYYPNLS